MRFVREIALASGAILFNTPGSAQSAGPCDLNHDGVVDTKDVTAAVNMTLGTLPCTANVVGPGICDVTVIQRVVNAQAGGTCVVTGTQGTHTVLLSWIASDSPNVAGYNIYRATSAAGPYVKLNSSLASSLSFTDSTVASGRVYYYVATTVNTDNLESDYSIPVQAVIPSP